ncbi:hypothetical protein DOLIC_00060 [Dolichomitus sp. PSUC_FEM 10030005]|nr:hypothetical protein [Dolichomitus sp. PSUC_FEM 10030005]
MEFNEQRRMSSRRSSGGSGGSRTVVLWCIFSLLLLITIIIGLFYYKFYRLKMPKIDTLIMENDQNYHNKKYANNDNSVNVKPLAFENGLPLDTAAVAANTKLIETVEPSAPPPIIYETDKTLELSDDDADNKKEYLHSTFLLVKDDKKKNKIYDFRLLKKPTHSALSSKRKDNIQDCAIEPVVFDDGNNRLHSDAVDTRSSDNVKPGGATVDLDCQSQPLPATTNSEQQNAVDPVAMLRQPQIVSTETASPKDYKIFNIQVAPHVRGNDEEDAATTMGDFITDETQTDNNAAGLHTTMTDDDDTMVADVFMPYNLKESSHTTTTFSQSREFEESTEKSNGQNVTASDLTKNTHTNGGGGIFTALFSKKIRT